MNCDVQQTPDKGRLAECLRTVNLAQFDSRRDQVFSKTFFLFFLVLEFAKIDFYFLEKKILEKQAFGILVFNPSATALIRID